MAVSKKTERGDKVKSDDKKEWHLDKKITIGLILTVLATGGGNGFAITWWAGRLDQNVSTEKTRNDNQDVQIQFIQDRFNDQEKAQVRMDTQQKFLIDMVKDMRDDLKSLTSEKKK